jgi:murein DD-endopeptidase MepM/ murein hydrolase activator NlpD
MRNSRHAGKAASALHSLFPVDSTMKKINSFLALALVAGSSFAAEIEAVLAHPPVDAFFSCSEHFAGQFTQVGDALGTDCAPQRLVEEDGRMWSRAYSGKGHRNEDWYGWHMDVLSPCACEVVSVRVNDVHNRPGVMGRGRAASVTLKDAAGVYFTLAHVREVVVAKGQHVVAGQPLAKIGNNGYSRSPHLHVAAWRGTQPLQIRWDQTKMKLPPEFRE